MIEHMRHGLLLQE